MYQYTDDDTRHIQQMDAARQDEERLRRILAEREEEAVDHAQRKQLIKDFIRAEKVSPFTDETIVTAASLALFANFLTKNYPVIKSFNMYLEEHYLHPIPDNIIFFDAAGKEYETVNAGPNQTPLGSAVFHYLAQLDLNGIKAYTERTLHVDHLNAWTPGG